MRLLAADRWLRLAAAILLAVSTAVAGLAHAPAREVRPSVDLLAYALPDGSLPELCLDGVDQPEQDHSRHALCMLACAVVALPGLLPAGASLVAPTGAARHARPVLSSGILPRPVWRAARARAPPSIA